MAAGMTYEESKKKVFQGFVLLGVVTLIEVGVALVGKGHVIADFHMPLAFMAVVMIALSTYKAYFIVKEFMHMGYEVRDLAMSVLLPLLLLVWAIIAFIWEGTAWGNNRQLIKDKDKIQAPVSSSFDLQADPETYTKLLG